MVLVVLVVLVMVLVVLVVLVMVLVVMAMFRCIFLLTHTPDADLSSNYTGCCTNLSSGVHGV